MPLFTAAARALDEIGIAFLELREPPADGSYGRTDVPFVSPDIRPLFRAPLVLNSDYTQGRAEAALGQGHADAIAFGRPFIGNPDLVARMRDGVELAKDDPKTWYTQGAQGYVDYPAAAELVAA